MGSQAHPPARSRTPPRWGATSRPRWRAQRAARAAARLHSSQGVNACDALHDAARFKTLQDLQLALNLDLQLALTLDLQLALHKQGPTALAAAAACRRRTGAPRQPHRQAVTRTAPRISTVPDMRLLLYPAGWTAAYGTLTSAAAPGADKTAGNRRRGHCGLCA